MAGDFQRCFWSVGGSNSVVPAPQLRPPIGLALGLRGLTHSGCPMISRCKW